jgi:hypothetical protein
MRIAQGFAAFLFLVALVLSQPLAAQQASNGKQNNGTPPANGNQGTGTRVEKFNVKQEFGPQATSRRGDRMGVATDPNQGAGTQGTGNNTGSNNSTEKFKQEFGPQSVSRRGDRMGVVSPQGQGGNHQPGANTADHAHFNPMATGGAQRTANPNGGSPHPATGSGRKNP